MFLVKQTPFENLGLFNKAFPGSTEWSDEFRVYLSIWKTQVLFVFELPVVFFSCNYCKRTTLCLIVASLWFPSLERR